MTTRSNYTARLRAEGFTLRQTWQARTTPEDVISGPDLTCYAAFAPDGRFLTHMIVQRMDGGLAVFFESASPRVLDDIAHLRRLAEQEEAA
jgi:hypothetical protein